MKHFTLSLILATILFSNLAISQNADEIISKYITAIGGSSNWEKVESIYYEGDFEAHGVKMKVYKSILHGKGMRLNMSSPQFTSFEIITPSQGWEYKPFLGQTKPEQITPDRLLLEETQYDAQGIFINYKTKGHSMTYAGKETINGKECYKVEVKHKSGKIEQAYFEASSFLLARITGKTSIKDDIVIEFDDYTLLPEAIWFPRTITTNPGTGKVSLMKIEINKTINEGIFKPVN